ncbi:MAG: hypothetical protein ACRDZX_10855 [Acidimicrobiales bacterium]
MTAELDLALISTSTGRRRIRSQRPELYLLLTDRYGEQVDPRTARFT